MTVAQYKQKLASAEGKLQLLTEQRDSYIEQCTSQKKVLEHLEKAQAFIQEIARKTQEQLKYHIEDVVQLAIDAIFPDEYQFFLEFSTSYEKTEANLVFEKKGYPVNILKSAGGGIVDIASLGLRIACWSLSKNDNVLILDEPVARIQPAELQAEAWNIIRELSRRLNLQFIIVSNSTNNGEAIHLVADREFRVTKEVEHLKDEEWKISRVEEV